MIVDFAISPIGVGKSLSAYVVDAFRVIRRAAYRMSITPWERTSKATETR